MKIKPSYTLGFIWLICALFVVIQLLAQSESRANSDYARYISALLSESRRNSVVMHRRLSEYSFKMHIAFRETGKGGKVKEKTRSYEMYGVGKRLFGVSLEKDGRNVSAKQLEKERGRTGAKMEEAEQGEADQALPAADPAPMYFTWRFRPRSSQAVRVSPSDFLEKFDFHSPRHERRDSREVIVLNFRPRAGVVFDGEIEYLSNLEGEMWMDAADKVVIRLVAWPRRVRQSGPDEENGRAKASENPAVLYEQMRTPEGVWVPKRVHVDAAHYSTLLGDKGVPQELLGYMTDYIWFNVEVKVGEPAVPTVRP